MAKNEDVKCVCVCAMESSCNVAIDFDKEPRLWNAQEVMHNLITLIRGVTFDFGKKLSGKFNIC